MPGWRGEELLHSTMMWGSCPATLLDYSSRLAFGRRESRTSRRFAPGDGKLPGMAAPKRLLACKACVQTTNLEVVKDRVTSPQEREVWVRFPPGSKDPVAQWIERLMSLAGSSRPAV
jgi:hypothetical protein